MNKEDNRRGGTTTQQRYGADFIAARARRGLLARELAMVAHSDRLTRDEIDAAYRQVMRRQAARMRAAKAAKAAKRAVASAAKQNVEAEA